MKFLYRFIALFFGLYAICIAATLFVLNNLEQWHEQIESTVSSYLGQSVDIAEMNSSWSGQYLGFYFGDIVVSDPQDSSAQYARVKHVAVKLDIKSLFYFWPSFSEVSIEQPKLTMESFADGSFRFVGKRYQPSRGQQIRSAWVINWLLTQKSADIHDGDFLWKHREGKQTKIESFSARYRYENKQHSFYAVGQNDADALGMAAILSGNFIWEDQWDAQATIWSGENVQSIENLNAELSVEQGRGSLKLQEFKVQRLVDVVNIFGQGSGLQRWLAQSQLSGKLTDVVLNFTGSAVSLQQWQFQAMASQLAWQPTKKLPGLSSIDAEISIDQQQGQVNFNSQNSSLSWPMQFSQGLAINELSGTLSMLHQAEDLTLKINNALIDTPILQVKDIKGIVQKNDSQDLYLDITSEVKTNSLRDVSEYFPLFMKTKFRDWWQNSWSEQQSANGTMGYRGTLTGKDFLSGKSKFNANIQANNVALDFGFQRDWPILTAEKLNVDWQNDTLLFSSVQPKLGKVKISNPTAKLVRLFNRNRELVVQGQISGELKEVVDFLQDGPLISPEVKQQRSPDRIAINSVTGRFSSELDISLPLNQIQNASLRGKGNIIDGELSVGDFLPVKKIQGQLNYTEQGVSGQGIQAELLGGKAKVNVKTLVPGKQLKVQLGLEGEVDIGSMQRLISPQLASRFTGKSIWTGFVEVDNRGVNLAMESDLVGTELVFPKPFAKSEEDTESVKVSFQARRDKESQLQIQAEELKLEFESINRQSLLDRGLIFAGTEQTQQFTQNQGSPVHSLPVEGIHIVGVGIDADIDEWLLDIQEMAAIPSQAIDSQPFNQRLRKLHFEPSELIIFEKNLGETDFIARSTDGLSWDVEVQGQYANGVGKMAPFAEVPVYEFTFDRLHWPSKKELLSRGVVPKSEQDKDTGKPNTYPDVDIQARNFRIFDKDFKQLSFKASANETAWQFKEILLSASGIDINATGQWFDDGSRNGMTKVAASASSKVGGKTLTDLGFGGFLQDGEININTSIFWRGAPAHFNFDRLNGDYKLDIRNGSFPKVDAESGRFFGLLNINALSRRLRLDFGDVFGKGLVFDRMKTQGIFNEGDIVLKDFYILSPSVYVEAQGKVGLEREDYDLRMLVSPQLGGNVALLAAISNPAAGAVVWLVDQIFKNQLNKIIIYTYDITGPWAEPKINRVIRNNSDEDSQDTLN